MSENIKAEKETNTEILNSKESVLKSLKQEFASTVNRVYINSLGKERDFREITVLEQKQLSRITIDNNSKNRKDVVFEAQCALINDVALTPGFNIYDLLEIDRLKLLIAIYQSNLYKNEIEFTCEECGAKNKYKLDFDAVLKRLDNIEVKTSTSTYENKNFKYTYEVEYPSVKRVLSFYRSQNKKYRNASKHEAKILDNMSNMDYVNLYVKSIEVYNKATKSTKKINFNEFNAGDVEELISIFPQDVLYSETGILYYVMNNYINPINESFDKQICFQCGTEHKDTVNSAESFL